MELGPPDARSWRTTNSRFSRHMIVVSGTPTVGRAASAELPERAYAQALAEARAALAARVLGEPEGVAAALRNLEALAHLGRHRGRALLLERPVPGWVQAHVSALHERAGCRRRGTGPLPRDDSGELPEALARLPWSGEWLVRVVEGLSETAASRVRPFAITWQTERNAFVEAHVGLVKFVVRRRGSIAGIAREDLIQEGFLAVCRAAERYDPDRGARFSSYAVPVIRHALAQYVRRMGPGLGAPPPVPAAGTASSSPTNGTGRRRILAAVSLDAPLDDGGTLADRIADTERPGPDLAAALVLDRERLRSALRKLPVEAEEIVALHWGLDGAAPRSVHTVASYVGRTPAEVAATIRGALGVLRDLVTRPSLTGRGPAIRRPPPTLPDLRQRRASWIEGVGSGRVPEAGVHSGRMTQSGRSCLYPVRDPAFSWSGPVSAAREGFGT
jgi:RNA polymerase sigma factor (sigma-70 family)